MAYQTTIEHRVAGIPCLIGVVDFVSVKGSYRYSAPSSDDYYGYEDIDYEILDRKGYRAKWLEAKVKDDSDILAAIREHFNEH